MPTQRKSPRDYTGSLKQKLEAEHAEAVRAREHEIGMTRTAAAAIAADEVVDAVRGPIAELDEAGEVVYVEPPARTIRVNSSIEQMTFGVGNIYDFEEGRQYRVPAHVADHLEELGYVWHAVTLFMGVAAALPVVRQLL